MLVLCDSAVSSSAALQIAHSLPPVYTGQAPLSTGFFQAILEWVAIPFSRGSSSSRDQTRVSCIVGGIFTIWATRKTPKHYPMDCSQPGSSVHGILQQEYWSGYPFPPPRDLPDPGIKPTPPALQADSFLPGKALYPHAAATAAKSLQSCPTLCDSIDSSPPGSPVPGILQVRTPEWVAIAFSNAWKWEVKVKSLSRVRLLATPWTAAHQAPPSMGFSRQKFWSGVPWPSP